MDTAQLLDPQLLAFVEAHQQSSAGAHGLPTTWPTSPVPSHRVTRHDLTVPGDPDVTIRVYRPVGIDRPLPCVFSMHAGGYVTGDRSMDDALFDAWCPTLRVVGVSVEYRLAPATPYPGPLMDCYVALKWVHDNAAEIGIDPQQIGLHGIGAGGGLAAALALVARDHREVRLAFQLLDSPMLDDRQCTHSSRVSNLPVWDTRSNELAWRAYLGELYGSELPIYAAAARCMDLRRLPRTFLSVGALDGFHDESVDFATRLNHTGIPAELHVYPGAPHGYHLAAQTGIAQRAARDKAEWLARQLAS